MTDASALAASSSRPAWLALDRLGVLIVAIAIAGAVLPFAVFRANRIVSGEGLSLTEALPALSVALLAGALLAGLFGALLRVPALVKLAAGFTAVAGLLLAIGQSGFHLTPPGDALARISPGAGFWLLLFAFSLLIADALTRLKLGPLARIAVLLAVAGAIALLLASGAWNGLSILKEYGTRASAFAAEARTHLALSFGSVALAGLIGVPLGILCHRIAPIRAGVLGALNIVQTIPSIALFGLLIAPLAWVAANVPGASAIGISGIGAAPAMVALVAYALLPLVANTVVGLGGVAPAAVDAARGMGMTSGQRLVSIEFPLALPVILTGVRIVLVQNIGLTTVAALIGGGGFGTFVFQGAGQTAMDLVLLGAVPTVALAFASAVVLDALVELSAARRGK